MTINLFLKDNYFIKKLCLNIFDYLGLKNRDELILLYNLINKSISNTDPLNRWTIVHVINSLKNQNQIKTDCIKQLIPITMDSNPYLRRMGLITIVNFIKNSTKFNIIEEKEFNSILCKYFNDPHPIIYGTAFYAITELKNRDYINLALAENFNKFCKNLTNLDDYYLSRTIFSLINFSKIFLFNNIEKNFKHIKNLFDNFYGSLKICTDFSKNLTFISAIYEIIVEIDKQNFNNLLKEDFNIFKNKKRLAKIANMLIRLYLSAKNKTNQLNLVLDLISKFVSNKENIFALENKKQKISKNENFEEIKINIQNYVLQGIFFIKISDKPFIAAKKLEILIHLANEENIRFIFDEFKRNLNYPITQIKKLIIKSIYFICKIKSQKTAEIDDSNNNQEITVNNIAYICVEKLIDCLKLKEEEIISQVIVSLRKLVNEIKDHTKYILIYSIKNFKKSISSNLARANIIWMVTQYIHIIPTVSVDFFRRILIDLETESDEVKSQIIGLALKLFFSLNFIKEKYTKDSDYLIEKLKSLINYCLEKLFYDPNYNIREKSRLAQFLISTKNEKLNLEINSNIITNSLNLDSKNFENFKFFETQGNKNTEKNVPDEKVNPVDSYYKNLIKEREKSRNFNLSLSHRLGISVNKNHENESEENIKNKIESLNQFENLFFFDFIEEHIDENFFNISLDDIINARKNENNFNGEETNVSTITDKEKFNAIKSQTEQVRNSVVNFDSKINIEETRNKFKNQLDNFLNDDNDQDEDEFEVEINKD